jgi:acyl-CoA dehydrogenase
MAMDFNLSEEDKAIQETVRRFGDEVLRPRTKEIDEKATIPMDILEEMGRLGLLAMPASDKYGGMGATAVQTELVSEEIGRGDISMATAVFFLLEAGWGYLLSRHGTEEAKNEVLPPVCQGKHFLGVASTEPGGGSDLAGMKTTSKRDGKDFIINGEKAFISGVTEAKERGGGHLTITKSLDKEGFSIIFVPTQAKGVEVIRTKNMGRMGISTGSLVYDNVRVPEKYLVGKECKGFGLAMEGFSVARTFVAAACVGAAERALEEGMNYIKARNVFGSPLGKFEGIQFELADQYAMVEAVKWQCRKAAWIVDQKVFTGPGGHSSEVDLAVASVKLMAPQIAFDTYKKVMMWFGASGYTKEIGLEMGFRGVMSYMVGAEGGLNIMRIIMGRELLGKEFVPYK